MMKKFEKKERISLLEIIHMCLTLAVCMNKRIYLYQSLTLEEI